MVVIFVDCCVGVYGTFRTIPTVESYEAGVFVPARTLIAVKLLNRSSREYRTMVAARPPTHTHVRLQP